MRSYLFTSESVAEGHPDKLADQISDAILDAFLAREPSAKVACETLVADNLIVIAGEFRTSDPAIFTDVRDRAESIARQVLRDAGYTDADTGIDPDDLSLIARSDIEMDAVPDNLREAHTHLDRVVESCYRPVPFSSDEERLEHLFALYEKMTKK